MITALTAMGRMRQKQSKSGDRLRLEFNQNGFDAVVKVAQIHDSPSHVARGIIASLFGARVVGSLPPCQSDVHYYCIGT